MFTEILGVIIIVGVLLILLLKHSGNNKKDIADDTEEGIAQAAQQLKKELENTGNRISKQINEQLDRLEKMIDTADKKTEELRRYCAIFAEEENKTSLRMATTENASNAADFDDLLNSVSESRYGGRIDVFSNEDSQSIAVDKKVYRQTESKHVMSEKVKKVHVLLDKGMSAEEISRMLSIGRGAVDMIVQIYEKEKVK
ncbi:hypothetical protein [Pectinatus haikarae]|uniref:DNA-binding transcriptional MerR regulator n=1 Tax=Pectinatus haikarae TaxID=349096 RepID=A0ABT9Y7E5_9FIRM|nr:hypothetical protein [Pectinatus haikarae]MDQ0203749.1 DNA-binding transcriptional MerR regulator [Pectinatus haikarae]